MKLLTRQDLSCPGIFRKATDKIIPYSAENLHRRCFNLDPMICNEKEVVFSSELPFRQVSHGSARITAVLRRCVDPMQRAVIGPNWLELRQAECETRATVRDHVGSRLYRCVGNEVDKQYDTTLICSVPCCVGHTIVKYQHFTRLPGISLSLDL